MAVARGNAASVLATAKSSATGPMPPQPVRATLPSPPPRSLAPETSPPSKPAPPPETISLPDKVSPHQTAPQPHPAPPPEPAQLPMLPLKAAVLPPSADDRPQTRRLRRLRSPSPCCPGACACPTFGRWLPVGLPRAVGLQVSDQLFFIEVTCFLCKVLCDISKCVYGL